MEDWERLHDEQERCIEYRGDILNGERVIGLGNLKLMLDFGIRSFRSLT